MNVKFDGFGWKEGLLGFFVFDNLIEGVDDKFCDWVKFEWFFFYFDQY